HRRLQMTGVVVGRLLQRFRVEADLFGLGRLPERVGGRLRAVLELGRIGLGGGYTTPFGAQRFRAGRRRAGGDQAGHERDGDEEAGTHQLATSCHDDTSPCLLVWICCTDSWNRFFGWPGRLKSSHRKPAEKWPFSGGTEPRSPGRRRR